MIVLVRADDRLLHGLVAVSWTSDIVPETILVANDEAASDHFIANMMKMAKPAGVKIAIKSIDRAAAALNNPVNERKRIFVVVDSALDAERLFDELDTGFTQLNIGTAGMKRQPDQEYRATLPQVLISRADFEASTRLSQQGVTVFAQVTPTRERMDFQDISNVFA